MTLSRGNQAANVPFVASSVSPDTTAAQGLAVKQAQGSIAQTAPSQVTFRSQGGFDVTLDTSTVQGLPPLQPNQPATLYYTQGTQGTVALWIEPGTSAVGQNQPGMTTQPSASIPTSGANQQFHGFIESVGVSTFTLSTDDGRKLTVDMSQLDPRLRQDVHPGTVATVYARASTQPNTVIAQWLQPDTSASPATR